MTGPRRLSRQRREEIRALLDDELRTGIEMTDAIDELLAELDRIDPPASTTDPIGDDR
ncbi:hypothetical protein [Streptomyces sp. NPDC001380]|uniref:hypothetical protein n=1 Tax=Streptomyces sp. NPDC001380 TaxID=3364566 RepID=UPI0036B98431